MDALQFDRKKLVCFPLHPDTRTTCTAENGHIARAVARVREKRRSLDGFYLQGSDGYHSFPSLPRIPYSTKDLNSYCSADHSPYIVCNDSPRWSSNCYTEGDCTSDGKATLTPSDSTDALQSATVEYYDQILLTWDSFSPCVVDGYACHVASDTTHVVNGDHDLCILTVYGGGGYQSEHEFPKFVVFDDETYELVGSMFLGQTCPSCLECNDENDPHSPYSEVDGTCETCDGDGYWTTDPARVLAYKLLNEDTEENEE